MTSTQISELLDSAARNPYVFRRVMTTKDYQAVMLHANGEITAGGYRWYLVGKSLGAGLYELKLVRA